MASKLKMFDHLKKKSPLKAVDIANEAGTSVCGTERLLDACTALGLLEKTPQGDFSHPSHIVSNLDLRWGGCCFFFVLIINSWNCSGWEQTLFNEHTRYPLRKP